MIHIVSFAAKKIKGGQTYCSHFLRFLRGDPILLNGEPCIGNAQECPVLPADSKWQSIHPPTDRPSRVEFLVGVVFRRWSRIVYKRRISKDNGERETAGERERERERERDPGEERRHNAAVKRFPSGTRSLFVVHISTQLCRFLSQEVGEKHRANVASSGRWGRKTCCAT